MRMLDSRLVTPHPLLLFPSPLAAPLLSCVLRMDHHCPLLANCVGFRNYKYFMLILFYAVCLTVWVLTSMLERFTRCFEPIISRSNFYWIDLHIGIAYGICLLVFIGVSIFMIFHIRMTMNALTSVERAEKKNSENEEVVHKWRIAHIKYDRGAWLNWLHVMGPPSDTHHAIRRRMQARAARSPLLIASPLLPVDSASVLTSATPGSSPSMLIRWTTERTRACRFTTRRKSDE